MTCSSTCTQRAPPSASAPSTAVGRLHLAFEPERVLLPQGALARFTERTRADREALAVEVARARAHGYAENREEWMRGLVVIAAPVLAGGRIAASLAVGAPSAALSSEDVPCVGSRLVAAARQVAERLEGRAPRTTDARDASVAGPPGTEGDRARRQGGRR